MASRFDELKGDPAFREAAHAVRGAASVLSGRAVTHEEAELLVVDHGAGIARADRDRVLRPFERASRARNFGGLGLGLWLASEVARAHRGRLTILDTPGGGTSVRVRLPRAK